MKLYTVTISHTALVLAEDENAALEMKDEILRWEQYPETEVERFSGALPHGWGMDD